MRCWMGHSSGHAEAAALQRTVTEGLARVLGHVLAGRPADIGAAWAGSGVEVPRSQAELANLAAPEALNTEQCHLL